MVKQRRLGESNQNELTQKGTNIKKKSSHQERSSRHSTGCKQSGVLPCLSRWLVWRRVGGYTNGSAARCRRTGCAATPLYETATSFPFQTVSSLWTATLFRTGRFCSVDRQWHLKLMQTNARLYDGRANYSRLAHTYNLPTGSGNHDLMTVSQEWPWSADRQLSKFWKPYSEQS